MRVLNILVKVALVALLAFAVVRQDLPQFQGKAMEGRALTYPFAVLVVPLIWYIATRSRELRGYPHLLDALLGMPFLIDMAGNALNLYDTITWWDDVNHFVNWGILTAAFGQFLLRYPLGSWVTAGLAWGFGGISGIVWEIVEYFTFVRNSPEMETAYTDTLGDLSLDLGGALVAAIVTAMLLRSRIDQWTPSRSADRSLPPRDNAAEHHDPELNHTPLSKR
jgi:hypothetical protein